MFLKLVSSPHWYKTLWANPGATGIFDANFQNDTIIYCYTCEVMCSGYVKARSGLHITCICFKQALHLPHAY